MHPSPDRGPGLQPTSFWLEEEHSEWQNRERFVNLFTPQTAHHLPINKRSLRVLWEEHEGESTTGRGQPCAEQWWREQPRDLFIQQADTSGSCGNSETRQPPTWRAERCRGLFGGEWYLDVWKRCGGLCRLPSLKSLPKLEKSWFIPWPWHGLSCFLPHLKITKIWVTKLKSNL